MTFSEEDLRMLAQAERDMDAGIVPFVTVEGTGRTLVSPEIFERLGLRQGQNISWILFGEIIKLHLEEAKRKLEEEQTRVLGHFEKQIKE